MDFHFTMGYFLGAFLFGLTFAAGYFYNYVAEQSQNSPLVHRLDHLSRGLLLGLALFHFLPEGILVVAHLPEGVLWKVCLALMSLVIFYGLRYFRAAERWKTFFHQVVQQIELHPLILPSLAFALLLLHSLTEGFILSVNHSLVDFSLILLAIVLHKAPEAIAFTVSLQTLRLSEKGRVVLIFMFALLTPIGVMFGQTLSFTEVKPALRGILSVLTGFLFIYLSYGCKLVGCVADHCHQEVHDAEKFFYLGLGLMAILIFL